MAGEMGKPWTDDEIETVLEAYFAMLIWELEGREYVKADVRAELEPRLPARSKKSIELKWCNVSAVLDEAGLPWVGGYKPMPNYQRKLRAAADGWLKRNPEVRSRLGN